MGFLLKLNVARTEFNRIVTPNNREMDGWKAKAQAAKDSAMSSLSEANKKRSTPATKYSPNRFDPAAPPPPTFSELSKTSSVLRQQEEHLHRRPPPPPKRAGLGGESSYIESNDTPSYTPALPGRSSGPSQSSAVAPGGMGGFKPISQYDDNDKLAFFELMDEVSLSLRRFFAVVKSD